jgi:hypothetical protein
VPGNNLGRTAYAKLLKHSHIYNFAFSPLIQHHTISLSEPEIAKARL